MAELRKEYEHAVRKLAVQLVELRNAGADAEAVARIIHAERRRLSLTFKARTPEPWRSELTARTVAVYGNLRGPSIDYLRAQGRSWEEIAESAARPGVLPKTPAIVGENRE